MAGAASNQLSFSRRPGIRRYGLRHAGEGFSLVLPRLRFFVTQLVVAVAMVVVPAMDGFYVVWSYADATAMTPDGLLGCNNNSGSCLHRSHVSSQKYSG